MEALQQPPKVAAAASLLQILRLPCKAKPLQGAHFHRAPTLQSGLISFLLQADPPPRPLGVVGGANPPPPSGPLTQAPSYSLRSQLPKCPHPKETSFLIASVATLGGGWGGPSNSPSAPKARLLLSFYGSTRLRPRPPPPPRSCLFLGVRTLTSESPLGFSQCHQLSQHSAIVPCVSQPWSPKQGLKGFTQAVFLWPRAVPVPS